MPTFHYPPASLHDCLVTQQIDWDQIDPNGIADDGDFWCIPAGWDTIPMGWGSEGTVWVSPEDNGWFAQMATVTTWRLRGTQYHPQLIENLIDEIPEGAQQYRYDRDTQIVGIKACSATSVMEFGFDHSHFGGGTFHSKSKVDLFEDIPTGDVFLVQRTSVWVEGQQELEFGVWTAAEGVYSHY